MVQQFCKETKNIASALLLLKARNFGKCNFCASRGLSERDGGCLLLRDIGPVPGSGHHGLGIDGSKSKVVAEFETSSIGGQVIHSQYVRIRGVDYQILHISPRQIRTVYTVEDCIINRWTPFYKGYYVVWNNRSDFSSRVRAMTPEASGVAALVPLKSSRHCPSMLVVL